MNLKCLAGAGIAILGFSAYFAGSVSKGLLPGISLIMLVLVPGYTLLDFLMKDLEELDKTILGFFIGLGFTAMVLYYLNFIGIASIRPVFSYGIGIICLGAIILERFKRRQKQAS